MSGRPGGSLANPALRAVAAAAVTVLAVGGGFRLFSGTTKEPAGATRAQVSDSASVPVAEDAPGVTTGEPQVELVGDALTLSVPVHNGEADDLVVTGVGGLPTGMRARLPSTGVRVPSHGDATISVSWSGPDCAGPLPEVLVGDLTWTGKLGVSSEGGLPGAPMDAVARSVWLDTCAGRATEGGLPREGGN